MLRRVLSIREGLEASTVTPGNAAPVVSRTVPAIEPAVVDCADARAGAPMNAAAMTKPGRSRTTFVVLLMPALLVRIASLSRPNTARRQNPSAGDTPRERRYRSTCGDGG